jgi:hypothetical protein
MDTRLARKSKNCIVNTRREVMDEDFVVVLACLAALALVVFGVI